jgi:ketopantoate reductase
MLQDIRKGKKTEVDAINGVVCEWARKGNVAAPYNQMVVRIVHEFAAVFGFGGPIKKWISFQLIPFAVRKHRDVTASMLQDIRKGKKTEVDAINGVVCEWAQKVNVATPYNQMVVRIVHEFEEGKGHPDLKIW